VLYVGNREHAALTWNGWRICLLPPSYLLLHSATAPPGTLWSFPPKGRECSPRCSLYSNNKGVIWNYINTTIHHAVHGNGPQSTRNTRIHSQVRFLQAVCQCYPLGTSQPRCATDGSGKQFSGWTANVTSSQCLCYIWIYEMVLLNLIDGWRGAWIVGWKNDLCAYRKHDIDPLYIYIYTVYVSLHKIRWYFITPRGEIIETYLQTCCQFGIRHVIRYLNAEYSRCFVDDTPLIPVDRWQGLDFFDLRKESIRQPCDNKETSDVYSADIVVHSLWISNFTNRWRICIWKWAKLHLILSSRQCHLGTNSCVAVSINCNVMNNMPRRWLPWFLFLSCDEHPVAYASPWPTICQSRFELCSRRVLLPVPFPGGRSHSWVFTGLLLPDKRKSSGNNQLGGQCSFDF